MPDDVRVVALGKSDADVVVRPPAVRRSRLLPTAAATATHAGTWTRQRLARNPVTVSIKTSWVAAWSAVVNEVALCRGLIGEVAAVDVTGGARLLGPRRENDQDNKQGGEPCPERHSALQPEPSVPRGAIRRGGDSQPGCNPLAPVDGTHSPRSSLSAARFDGRGDRRGQHLRATDHQPETDHQEGDHQANQLDHEAYCGADHWVSPALCRPSAWERPRQENLGRATSSLLCRLPRLEPM